MIWNKSKKKDCFIKNYCKNNKVCRHFGKMNRNKKILATLYKIFKVLISLLNIGLILYLLYENTFGDDE